MVASLAIHPVDIEEEVEVIGLKVVLAAREVVEEEELQVVREVEVVHLLQQPVG